MHQHDLIPVFVHVYLQAVALARDTARLKEIRTSLREKCLATWGKRVQDILCSEAEAEFRKMWLRHLEETA